FGAKLLNVSVFQIPPKFLSVNQTNISQLSFVIIGEFRAAYRKHKLSCGRFLDISNNLPLKNLAKPYANI
ncbi:MAG: hypothetical protein ACP5N0_10635, partial [Methanosarcina sp.]